jgi:hypothetical protein
MKTLLGLSALLLTAGCGDASLVADAAVPDLATTGDLGVTAPDAAGDAGVSYVGRVLAVSTLTPASSGGQATLAEYRGVVFPTKATLATIGACRVESTDRPVPITFSTSHSAGVITITGGAQTVTFTPDASGAYPVYSNQSAGLWSGGETITVTATGAEVPAFSASATAPAPVQITQPAKVPAGTVVMFDRTQDFPVSWVPGSGGELHAMVVVNSQTAGEYQRQIDCAFQATAGSGVIPVAALTMLPAGRSGYYDVRGRALTTITVGAYAVDVELQSINNGYVGAQIQTQ